MDGPAIPGQWKPEDWDRLQDLVDGFEEACQRAGATGEIADLVTFLPPPGDPLRRPALEELLKSDLEVRWRQGPTRGRSLEDYLRQFPELGSSATVPAALIYEEFRARQLFGDRPGLDAYRQRFPDQFAELHRQLLEQPLPTIADPPGPAERTMIVPGGPTPPSLDAVTPLVGRGYELVRRIGSGSFGEVWRAEAPGGVEVAIKVITRPLDHQDAQRELRALELIRGLRHPFLLMVSAYWAEEGRLLIVMELADGNLRDRLKDCRKQDPAGIPLRELIRYFREAAEALDFLHKNHVLHRDIKPDNILLLQSHAKVADFDLARLCAGQQSVLASGCGTPAYMAPEALRGQVSERSDQYSLAITYAELRLQRPIFPQRHFKALLADAPEPLPSLDPLGEAEQQVLQRALAGDPAGRFSTCSEFVRALEKAIARDRGLVRSDDESTLSFVDPRPRKEPEPVPPLTPPPSGPRGASPPRYPGLVVFLLAALGAALGAAGFFLARLLP
jgi:serine/threonine protein kinase